MIGYIYLITDTTNGKQYVGQHHYDKEELDPSYHGSGHIIKSIFKKRPETIKEEYIKTCYSEEEMNNDEKHYIKVFDTLYPNGYNLTEGGDGVVACEETRKKMSVNRSGKCIGENHPLYGKHRSEDVKEKLRKTHIGKQIGEDNPFFGKHHTEETKKKISESNKGLQSGEKHPMFGKHHTEEARKKISEARKGKYNTKCSKVLLQYTLDGELVREWPSMNEVQRNGFDRGVVRLCCQGKYKQAYGFIWKYKEVS